MSAKSMIGVFAALAIAGCGDPGLKPAPITPERRAELKKEEQDPERKLLAELEKKFGPDHPEVKQKKMELGIIPFPGGEGVKKD
jgi:hypothetical protein